MKFNGGCQAGYFGGYVYGEIEQFIEARLFDGCRSPPVKFAIISWFETIPRDGNFPFCTRVYTKPRSKQAKDFAHRHRVFPVEKLRPINISFEHCPRHWGSSCVPESSMRVVIANLHQVKRPLR